MMPHIVKCNECGFVYELISPTCSRCGEQEYTMMQQGKDR
jgi:uncharacterized OB-fold protein